MNNNKKNSVFDNIIQDTEEEKKAALILFKEGLVDILESSSEDVIFMIEDYNGVLIALLSESRNFRKDLENALYKNEETLTDKKIIIKNKTYKPSVGNWLRDYIESYGSGIFDNVKLSNYLVSSRNARMLSKEEKKIVQKLLLLYRNLKFFPESQKDIPIERWEIIPVKSDGGEREIGNISGPPKTEGEKDIEELIEEEKKYSEGGLERLAIEEEIDKKKKKEELEIMAKKFPEGSLEKRAIEEEIKNIN